MSAGASVGQTFPPGMYSSLRQDWATPDQLFYFLRREFNFELDVCASPETAKCDRFFTIEDNALEQEWAGVCWMKPPYGRHISRWIHKAHESAIRGATVVCLLPSRTDTSWWHKYCMRGEVRFLRGRLNFDNRQRLRRAPFPSVIVIFRPGVQA